MAPHIIFHCPLGENSPGAGWTITQDPMDRRDPNLVRFRRGSRARTLLDQIAEWDPYTGDWRCTRWVPKAPKVPQWLIGKVVAHMNFEGRA